MDANSIDLTILMPCLNEAETLERCIQKAQLGIQRTGVTGEILIADNGSTDGSIEIAERNGARVARIPEKGYGSALRGGTNSANGRWIIMGDSDDSYDFSNISGFVEKLRAGSDLVMGCRLPKGGGTIMPGAMPWKNRWIGNPVLSFLGRLFFRTPIRDFHCGLRGYSKTAYDRMDPVTTGMEFASEMVMKATLYGMKIEEVPITLHKDGRSRPPHLKPWRDGWRHLRFMLIYSPRWLFFIPGLFLSIVGAIAAIAIYVAPVHMGRLELDAGSLVISCLAVITGVQLVAFAYFTKVFAIAEHLLPPDPAFARVFKYVTLERGALFGVALVLAGLGIFAWAVLKWGEVDFGFLPYEENIRRIIASSTFVVLGIQAIFSSFFLSVLGLKTSHREPPSPKA